MPQIPFSAAEGDQGSQNYLKEDVNGRYYADMSVSVTGLSSSRYLRRLEAFWEEEEV